MKNNTKSYLRRFVHVIFILSSIIAVYIVYRDTYSKSAFNFIIAYIIFSICLLIEMAFTTFLKLKKMEWPQIRTILVKFIIMFLFFSCLTYGYNYFFKPDRADLSTGFYISFGLAIGMSSTDIVSQKKKDK